MSGQILRIGNKPWGRTQEGKTGYWQDKSLFSLVF
jgi:hypothetical protein